MTNYNERLDEVLHINGVKDYGVTVLKLIDVNEAKQALTSLYKELVAEAKPEKQNSEMVYSTWGDGYDSGTDQFEQNLLKALEEV